MKILVLALLAGSAVLARPAAAPQGAPPAPAAGEQSVGVTVIWDDEKVGVMSRALAARSGDDPARLRQRLRALQARGGPSLYLQVQHAGPVEVEIVPADRGAVVMPLRRQMMMGAIPEEADPRQSVVMFWVLNGEDGRYTLTVPNTFRHVAVVVNGREVANEPLNPAAGRRTYRAR
jgi:hypothetical protein